MDLYDEAQALELRQREAAIEQQTIAAGLSGAGLPNCADCGEPIPLPRRKAMPSAIRCVNCQAWAERLGRVPKP